MASTTRRNPASAANRFGIGARPGELAGMRDPVESLQAQISGAYSVPGAFSQLPTTADYVRLRYGVDLPMIGRMGDSPTLDSGKEATEPRSRIKQGDFTLIRLAETDARWQYALTTPDGFVERLVRFWTNHFAVSIDNSVVVLYPAPMEREVIRSRMFGTFTDLLLEVESHPAMLAYLDNADSIGPDSEYGNRFKPAIPRQDIASRPLPGLNENLAREIFELHTLGVNGGYQQADIIEFAKCLTGWSIVRRGDSLPGPDQTFVFRADTHQPGERTVLGKRYADEGIDQARAVMRDLALHPATARHLAFKLARHFVSDHPAPALVERLANRYLKSGGQLRELYSALVSDADAWGVDATKFRAPEDFLLAAFRALAISDLRQIHSAGRLLDHMGQTLFMPRSPAGYPDTADAWISSSALWTRLQAVEQITKMMRSGNDVPEVDANAVLGTHVRPSTLQAMQRAESSPQAWATLFASPEFQWRT